jgi:GGDEF domain-containing protein
MSLQGPIIVVADAPVPLLLDRLAGAGAFPLVEARGHQVAEAVRSVQPAAIILADPDALADPAVGDALEDALAAVGQLFVPVITCVRGDAASTFGPALPIDADAPLGRLIARLRAALRVRTLHGSVLRRAASLQESGGEAPDLPDGDPLDDATVIVTGRGRAYPALTVTFGERVGLTGALSLEAASRILHGRDIDGIVIGDGFSKRMVEMFLAELGADARFRDLPVGVLEDVVTDFDPERLPNLERVTGDPARIADRVLPLVRIHAFSGRLRRMAISLDAKGVVDPHTGLRTRAAFLRDLAHAVGHAADRGNGLALARISLANPEDSRLSLDAARIVARLVRTSDFACRDQDGTILVAFTDTGLGPAHVVARRIASVLRHTALAPGRERGTLDTSVAIAALNGRDTVDTLIARVSSDGMVAAG